MKILAIEFSSMERSVAIVEDRTADGSGDGVERSASPGVEAEAKSLRILAGVSESGGRRAIELIEEALLQAGSAREDIAVIAVGLGPGSYTGIRGAIALAQGWQIGRGTKLLGISSVECLAAVASRAGYSGSVHIVIDAQRSEFYLATYQIDATSFREVEALRLAQKSEIEALAAQGGAIIGPAITRWFPNATAMNPDASLLGCLAAKHSNFVPGENLEPIYLRETTFVKAPPSRLIE